MSRKCSAYEYSQCAGNLSQVDVIFKYRDKHGCCIPDEIINICLCKTHHMWLNALHQGKPLEMRGDVAMYALHDDLFMPFANKNDMYTVLEVKSYEGESASASYYLVGGRDIEKFKHLLSEHINTQAIKIYEEGFFQTAFFQVALLPNGTAVVESNYVESNYVESIYEINKITGELVLDALANNLVTFYKPVPDGEIVRGSSVITLDTEYITLDTEYTKEPIPAFFKEYFAKKLDDELFSAFKKCILFINHDIASCIIELVHVDLRELFVAVRQLINTLLGSAALEPAACALEPAALEPATLDTEVLWITYVMANHRLYESPDNKKKLLLRNNATLCDLFIAKGLEKNLLALAISGERLRFLSVHQRDHYDILYDNQFVVEYLVPKYVARDAIVYTNSEVSLTPIEYWNYFSNTTLYVGGGFLSSVDHESTFDKNENIREYLKKL